MRGRVNAMRTFKGLVADLRFHTVKFSMNFLKSAYLLVKNLYLYKQE